MPHKKTIEKAKPLAKASAKKEETILPTVRTAAHPSNPRARTLCAQTSQAVCEALTKPCCSSRPSFSRAGR